VAAAHDAHPLPTLFHEAPFYEARELCSASILSVGLGYKGVKKLLC